jgi:hypothetical protein
MQPFTCPLPLRRLLRMRRPVTSLPTRMAHNYAPPSCSALRLCIVLHSQRKARRSSPPRELSTIPILPIDSTFADLNGAEQIANVLTARRTAPIQPLQSTMQAAATNELHGSTTSESKLLGSILTSDVFADTQDLAREVCLCIPC